MGYRFFVLIIKKDVLCKILFRTSMLKNFQYPKSLVITLIIFSFYGCSNQETVEEEEKMPEKENTPPETFDLSLVENNSLGVELRPELSWESSFDKDGDSIFYDILLDTSPNPSLKIAENLNSNSFQFIEGLNRNTTYNWKVIAKDGKGGVTESSQTNTFLTRYYNRGIEATSNGSFSGRVDHSSVVFDNKIWVIGGFVGNPNPYKNDVWYSEDGIEWQQATDNAAFSARKEHASVVFNDKIWVIGGNVGGDPLKDVWYSEDGVNWTLANTNADFPAISGHTLVEFDNKIWILGGTNENTYESSIWHSSDGISWTAVTGNDTFPERQWHSSVVFDNKIWVIGGSTASFEDNSDVWYSDDGNSWIEATPNAEYPWRLENTAVVFDNKIWIIGGLGNSCCSDVWYTENGSNWTRAIENSDFSNRNLHTSLVFNNRIWSIGGNNREPGFLNDVWFMD